MTAPRLPRPLTRFSAGLSVVAGLLLLVLAGLTVADVLGRSLADRSIVGTVDISTLLLVGVAFLGLAAAEVDGRHVDVDLVEARLPRTARIVLAVVRCVLLVGLGAVLVWGLTETLVSAYDRGETTNDILRLPTWPAKLVLVVTFALFFVTAVWKTVHDVQVLRRGEDLPPAWADQVVGDVVAPTEGDPAQGDPTGGDPTEGDPAQGAPAGGDAEPGRVTAATTTTEGDRQ